MGSLSSSRDEIGAQQHHQRRGRHGQAPAESRFQEQRPDGSGPLRFNAIHDAGIKSRAGLDFFSGAKRVQQLGLSFDLPEFARAVLARFQVRMKILRNLAWGTPQVFFKVVP